jgi:hypothetical protein
MTKSQAKKTLEDAGFGKIDWGNIDWVKLFEIIRALVAMFKSQPQAARAPKGDETYDSDAALDHAKCHFECIKEVAECGVACCEGEL